MWTYDIGRLDVIFITLLDLLLQLVERDLLVLDDQVDLELLDTETHSDQRGGTPHESVLLAGENVGLEFVHGDDGLGSRLDLASLLLVVLGQALSLELLGLGVLLLIVATEQIDVIILLLGSRALGGVDGEVPRLGTVCGVLLGRVSGQGGELRLEGKDVVVPSPGIWVLLRGGDGLDLLEDLDVCL